MERLQKVIASAGYASRRKAEELILSGSVIVNGEVIKELGTKVSSKDDIMINGIHLQKQENVYYLLNKPRSVICSTKDEHNRPTVIDLIETNKRIYPIGRLDFDTTGLLLLTNDGELTNILMHPKNHVPKRYIAHLNKALAIEDYKKLKDGVLIDNIKCKPTRIKIKKNDTTQDFSIIEVTIIEGRNHIIKKLFKSLGYTVTRLNRVEYGFLNLNGVSKGFYRPLTIKEVKKLYEYKN